MTKDTLQWKASQLLTTHHRLVCQWATSCGKSGVALKFLSTNQWMECLILVPEQNNIQNWKDEFNKFGLGSANVTIACYASLHKYTDTKWDLLVLDEVPHMDTEKRIKLLQSVKGDYVLALGAVIDEDEMNSLEQVYGKFYKSFISLGKAIDMGILPIPEIRILHMALSPDRKSWYKGRFVSEKEQYEDIQCKVEAAVTRFNIHASPTNKRSMQLAGAERKRFLGKIKTEAAKRVCDAMTLHNKRFICFCSSIAQANLLGGELAFTSKTPASAKVLESFNNHTINSMYVVGKCIEGQNLVDIDCGIIIQLGGKERITVQSIGRVIRSEKPVVYVIVFDDTKDDGFLYTVTHNIPKEYIKHYNF